MVATRTKVRRSKSTRVRSHSEAGAVRRTRFGGSIAIPLSRGGRIIAGHFLDREKKFRVAVELFGTTKDAFLSHTGRLSGLLFPGAPLLLEERKEARPARLPYEVLAVKDRGVWVCLRSQLANAIAEQAITLGAIADLPPDFSVKREVGIRGGRRVDLGLRRGGKVATLLEVKSCCVKIGVDAIFPDTATERGVQQVRALEDVLSDGLQSWLCFVAMRPDVRAIRVARETDASFHAAVAHAVAGGLRTVGFTTRIRGPEIRFEERVPVII